MIHPTTWPDWMPLQPKALQGGWLHMRLVFDPLLQQLGLLRGVTHSSLIGEQSFPPDRYLQWLEGSYWLFPIEERPPFLG